MFYYERVKPRNRQRFDIFYLQSINVSKFSPTLSETEVKSIIDSVFRIEKIELYPNTSRRFIYNPDYDLSDGDKRFIGMT